MKWCAKYYNMTDFCMCIIPLSLIPPFKFMKTFIAFHEKYCSYTQLTHAMWLPKCDIINRLNQKEKKYINMWLTSTNINFIAQERIHLQWRVRPPPSPISMWNVSIFLLNGFCYLLPSYTNGKIIRKRYRFKGSMPSYWQYDIAYTNSLITTEDGAKQIYRF